jgi:hypothetical protein
MKIRLKLNPFLYEVSMASFLSGLASAASGVIHPISTTRQHTNNILYGDPRLEALCQHMIRTQRNPSTEQFGLIAEQLEALIETPSDFGINEGIDEAFQEELEACIAYIRELQATPDDIDVDPILTLLSRYRGIVPNLRFEIESTIKGQKEDAIHDIHRLIQSQFSKPRELGALIEFMPDEAALLRADFKDSVAAWRGAIAEPLTLQIVIFGHDDALDADQTAIIEALDAMCEACADDGGVINAADVVLIKKALQKIYDKRLGAVEKIKSVHRKLMDDTASELKKIQDGAIKPPTEAFKKLFLAAQNYAKNRTPANLDALNVEIASYQATLQPTDPDRLFYVAKTQADFDAWFEALKEKKTKSQGLLFEAIDGVQERIISMISPITSFFESDGSGPVESRSLLDKAISLIEKASGNGIKSSVTFSMTALYHWIQKTQFPKAKTEEKTFFNDFFTAILRQIESCDFSKKEQREALVRFIKGQLASTPIMIDQFLALPTLLDTTSDTNIEDLKAALKTENHEALQAWLEKIGGESKLDEVLFSNPELEIDEEEKELLKKAIIQCADPDQFTIGLKATLQNQINLLYTTSSDLDAELLEELLETKATTKKETESKETNLESLVMQFSETTTLYLVYEICSRLLGFNTSSLEEENQKTIAHINRMGLKGKDKEEAYAKWQLENDFLSRNEHSFKSFISSLRFSDDRKKEFIETLQEKLAAFKGNPILVNFLIAVIPYMTMMIEPIIAHFVLRSAVLIQSISQLSSTDPSKKINTKLIRIVTGYFNKISSIYEEIPEKNRSQSVSDYLKINLKKDIMLNGETTSIKELFSLVNFELVSAYFPDITISSYLEEVSQFLIDEISSTSSGSLELLNYLLIFPAYVILRAFSFLIVKPLEIAFGYISKQVLWRLLNITQITESIVDKLFSKLNESTGLYHIIKEPLADVLEDIDFSDTAIEEESSDHSAILSQQDDPKKDLNEMYRSMKKAIAWHNLGISKQDIEKILKSDSKDPLEQSILDRTISQIETRFLSEIIADGLLTGIHKITQAQFLQETILKKGLGAGIHAIENLGQVSNLGEIEEKHLKTTKSDTKFQKLSKKAMSKLFDKIFKKALADLGAKQKVSIDQFIEFVNANFSRLSIDEIDSFSGKTVLEKIKYLEKLQKEIQAMMIHYSSQKEQIMDDPSINETLKTILKRKVVPLEKILSSVVPAIHEQLNRLKQEHEASEHKDKFSKIVDQRNLIIASLKSLKENLSSEETVDYSEITSRLREIDAESKRIAYALGAEKIELSHESKDFKFQVERLTTQFLEYTKILKEYEGRKKIERIFADQSEALIGIEESFQSAKQILLAAIDKEDLPSTEIVGFQTELTTLSRAARDDKPVILAKIHERIERLVLESSKSLDAFKFIQLPGFSEESKVTPPPIAPIDFNGVIVLPLKALKKKSQDVKKIDYLSISVAEHTPILKTGKNIILKQLRVEVEKYKKFFSSTETLETFFYNCCLPVFG